MNLRYAKPLAKLLWGTLGLAELHLFSMGLPLFSQGPFCFSVPVCLSFCFLQLFDGRSAGPLIFKGREKNAVLVFL